MHPHDVLFSCFLSFSIPFGVLCRQCLQPCAPEATAPSPPPPPCSVCLRSVVCAECAAVGTRTADPGDHPSSAPAAANGVAGGVGRGNVGGGGGDGGGGGGAAAASSVLHGSLECEALSRLSALQRSQPDMVGSLLGGSTVYLRLLLRLLAMRAEKRVRKATAAAAAAGAGRGAPR